MSAEGEGGARADGPRVVLVAPKRGSNVGAACRAIRNMGGSGLAVVGGEFDEAEARRTSVHAADALDARVPAADLREAVRGCRLVVGTSPREGPWRIPVRYVDEVFAEARARGLAGADVALVFGPEDRGLCNEELSRCHVVAAVRTAGAYDSLNLAQAVVVCLYEWVRSGLGAAVAPAAPSVRSGEDAPAAAEDQAAAVDDLRDLLDEVGFLHGDQAGRVMASVASMLTRGGLAERDVRILRGIARQVRWAVRRGAGRQA